MSAKKKTPAVTDLENKIWEAVDHMGFYDLVCLWNEYTNATDKGSEYIYLMEEFNDVMERKEPMEIASATCQGSFFPQHDFFTFQWGNCIASFCVPKNGKMPEQCPINCDAIVEYIVCKRNPLWNEDIEEILNMAEKEAGGTAETEAGNGQED